MHNANGDRRSARNSLAEYIGIAGVVCFTGIILLLHGLQPHISLLYDAMSYYVYGQQGWLLTASLLVLGIGSASLAAGLFRIIQGKRSAIGVVCIGIWSIGLTLGALFPTDPLGSWNEPPSTSGMIHFTAANFAFLSITLAALLTAPRFLQNPRWNRVKPYILPSVILIVIAYLALTVSTVSIFISHGPPFYFGLTERLFFLACLFWLVIAAVGLVKNPNQSN